MRFCDYFHGEYGFRKFKPNSMYRRISHQLIKRDDTQIESVIKMYLSGFLRAYTFTVKKEIVTKQNHMLNVDC